MDLSIVSESKNLLLHRKELNFKIKSNVSVSRDKIKEKIIALTNSEASRVIIDKLDQRAGEHVMTGTAKVYDTKKDLQDIELKFLKKRNKVEDEKAKKVAPVKK